MTRGAFITQLEKRLADLFPSWEAKEQELTASDIGAVWVQMADCTLTTLVAVATDMPAHPSVWPSQPLIKPEVKA